MGVLDKINSPADLRRLPVSELDELAADIRREILDTVSRNGGHLASSLGAVELTIALHRVFETPADAIIWDVGHQSYAHKLLTGRRELFRSLRQAGGCSGFQSRRESPEYDVMGGGHAGTAISSALGLEVAAMKKFGANHPRTVAVVGDGSLNCGISLEGLNNVSGCKAPLVIILNDNRMSISSNVGALPSYLNRIISSGYYGSFKKSIKNMLSKSPVLFRGVQKIEEKIKALLLPAGFFEELGFRYLGPVNGHDISGLIRFISLARNSLQPVVVHVVTDKGRGYPPALDDPETYHGVGSFDLAAGVKPSGQTTYSGAFGKAMCELAEKHKDAVAITAAMTSGTGLSTFAEKYPDRIFDTGIAEEHALVFAAGLAAGGLRPVAAVYSTFMQRAFDQIYHDICIQELPVVMALDRAGAVEDGPSHHGIYDLSFLRAMPNLTIFAPADEAELRQMLFAAYELNAPAVIRYSRGSSNMPEKYVSKDEKILPGKAAVLRPGRDLAVWTYGKECVRALQTAEILQSQYGIDAAVVNARSIKPFDRELAENTAARMPVFVMEDHTVTGGLADAMRQAVPIRRAFGWPDNAVIPHGCVDTVRKSFGLDTEAIAAAIAEEMK